MQNESQGLLGPKIVYKKTARRIRSCSTTARFVLILLFGMPIYLYMKSSFLTPALKYGYYSVIFGSRTSDSEVAATYLDALETNYARNWSEIYTSQPHLAGTNYGLVQFTKDKFEEYGLKTDIKTYHVYLNFPNDHALKLVHGGNVVYEASLKEDAIPEDPTSSGDDLIPTFHGYSANGNVTAQYFYANYGTKQDFDLLESLNVEMDGKIAIVRYGEIYRGLKVKFAQEHGCIGVLMYSDPDDDGDLTPANGYAQYPNGPARHESSVQRGSVMYLSQIPGDPTTPGYASKEGVERVDPYHSTPKIPSLPVSYKEVLPILSKLNGHGISGSSISTDWVGALPDFDYSIGPSIKYTVNLYNDQIYNITPIWNVFGEIEGILKDDVILIGNHRDAWIKGGAGDPNSGSASMLEIIRGFSELTKTGWKPLRSIVFASWDAEEPGLVGSTEYAEEFARKLQKNVVAYYNLDASVTGTNLNLAASPLLNNILRETAKLIQYPKGGSLYDHFQQEKNDKIDILGSGSDYTVFLEHLGIPSVDLGFGGSATDPIYQYHSNYDSFYWMDKLTDPGFVYHNVMSKYLGLLILKLSEKEMIDFKVHDYSVEIQSYFEDVISSVPEDWLLEHVKMDLHDTDASFIGEITSVYNIGKYLTSDEFWRLKKQVTTPEEITKHKMRKAKAYKMKFENLTQITASALEKFTRVAEKFDLYCDDLQYEYDHSDNLSIWNKLKLLTRIQISNLKLKYLERNFLHDKGLIGRPWFKHLIYASGRYTGYEGQTLPGLQEAIEDRNFKDTTYWVSNLLKSIRRVSVVLNMGMD